MVFPRFFGARFCWTSPFLRTCSTRNVGNHQYSSRNSPRLLFKILDLKRHSIEKIRASSSIQAQNYRKDLHPSLQYQFQWSVFLFSFDFFLLIPFFPFLVFSFFFCASLMVKRCETNIKHQDLPLKLFIHHSEAQSSVNAGVPGAGEAENFVSTKIFCIPGSRLLNKS